MKKTIARALRYLDTSFELRLGGKALIGLAYLKAGTDPNHPRIQEALEVAIEAARSTDIERAEHVVYSTALCIIFLVALDSVEYRAPIEKHLSRLLNVQKGHGGWGYAGLPTGDTSMTQMAVLSLWEAQRGGVQVPTTAWNAVTNWLLRTQDPSGGFGYQARDPGNFSLAQQSGVRISLTAGALGSLYIAMRPPETDAARTATRSTARNNTNGRASAGRWRQAIQRGHGWWQENFDINPLGYTHYFLYALERYQAFRQSAGDKPWPRDWYDQGARLLINTQNEDGSWIGTGANGLACDTAFAILFLVRSTKQRLDLTDSLGSGMLTGGRGLPRDPSEMQLRNGKLVGPRLTASSGELLRLMDDPTDPDYLAAVETFKEAAIHFDDESLAPHIEQLRKLMSGKDAPARAVAIRALARRRNLDDVPLLITALEDRDSQVVMAARDGLRFISRRMQGFGLSNSATETEWRAAVANWKTWYGSLRPGAKLDK